VRRSLLIANDFPPVTSGIATVFYQIWKRLSAEETWILAPRLEQSDAVDATLPCRVKRVRLPVGETGSEKAAKTLLTLAWLLWLALFDRPARVHCGQVFSSGTVGWILRALFGIPYIVWVYGSETIRLAGSGLSHRLMQCVLRDADTVVTNSSVTSREFQRFGVPQQKLVRVYPGVDPRIFRPDTRDPAWVERHGLSNRRVILTVARLDQRKGHDVVLRALRRLPDDVVYLIGGKGREEDRLRRLADECSVEDRVRFLGYVPNEDLPTLYNLCDVFVMPNRVTAGTALAGDIEGFGITFIEAGSCGKPVVGGKFGGSVEAVLAGETGLLVDDPSSDVEVAEAVRRLLDDGELRKKLGRNARLRIEREFDWDRLARQVKTIL
jgi:phosphatidylinositol alpha-1,6-mannosyltransferase